MKKVFIFYFLLVHLFILWIIYRPQVADEIHFIGRENLQSAFYHRRDFIKNFDKVTPGNSIIFLGDSITERNPAITVNYGWSGAKAKDLLQITGLESVKKARLIILQIGTNDINEYNAADFEALAHSLPDVPLIWCAVPPVDRVSQPDAKIRNIEFINEHIQKMCSSKPGCRFVDLTDKLADQYGDFKYHGGDGVHFGAEGYRIWNESIEVMKTSY